MKFSKLMMKKTEQISTVAHNTLTGLNSKWYILSNGMCVPATYYPYSRNNMRYVLWTYDMKTNSLKTYKKGSGHLYNNIDVMNCILEYNTDHSRSDVHSIDITEWFNDITFSAPSDSYSYDEHGMPMYPSIETIFLCYQIYHKQWFAGNESVRFCILTNDADGFEINVKNKLIDTGDLNDNSWRTILNFPNEDEQNIINNNIENGDD